MRWHGVLARQEHHSEVVDVLIQDIRVNDEQRESAPGNKAEQKENQSGHIWAGVKKSDKHSHRVSHKDDGEPCVQDRAPCKDPPDPQSTNKGRLERLSRRCAAARDQTQSEMAKCLSQNVAHDEKGNDIIDYIGTIS